MTFDLSTPENREAFKRAIMCSDYDALKFVCDLATKLGVHRAYDETSPGLFVERNDREEGGTIVGICGGRRFLVNDWRIVDLVKEWVLIEGKGWIGESKSNRALALLVLADGLLDLPSFIWDDSAVGGRGFAVDLIVRHLKLYEEVGRIREEKLDASDIAHSMLPILLMALTQVAKGQCVIPIEDFAKSTSEMLARLVARSSK